MLRWLGVVIISIIGIVGLLEVANIPEASGTPRKWQVKVSR